VGGGEAQRLEGLRPGAEPGELAADLAGVPAGAALAVTVSARFEDAIGAELTFSWLQVKVA
jgi:hypothetical protein